MQTLTLIPIGHDPRMDLVKSCIRGKAVIQELSPDVFFEDIPAAPETGFAPLLFLAAVDDLGMGEDFVRILRRVRALGDGLRGYAAGVILLGSTELDTKNAARELIFALDMAGCAFPERPLAEATGSMRNLRVTQRTHALNDPEEALAFSGYQEVTLLSLSTSDYRPLNELCDGLLEYCVPRDIGLSLPSLRADNFSLELMQRVQKVRKSGLTFAPEAGSQRLRDIINKNVTEEDLMNACRTAFSRRSIQNS